VPKLELLKRRECSRHALTADVRLSAKCACTNKLAVMVMRHKYSQGLPSDLSARDIACVVALRLRSDANVLVDEGLVHRLRPCAQPASTLPAFSVRDNGQKSMQYCNVSYATVALGALPEVHSISEMSSRFATVNVR